MEAGYLELAGGRLFFESWGEGEAVVLVHSAIADHRQWDGAVERLARGRRAVRYDLRGFGKSVVEAGGYSHADDLVALLDHLGLARAAVVGVSFGGRIALDAALEHPDRVAALTLVGAPLAGLDHTPTDAERLADEREEALDEAQDWQALADHDVAVWIDGLGQPPGRAPAPVRGAVKAMALGNYVGFARRFPDPAAWPRPHQLEPPAAARLGRVEAPTLVLVGELDTPYMHASAAALAAGIARVESEVIAGVAHLPDLEAPEAFWERVEAFWERVARPGS